MTNEVATLSHDALAVSRVADDAVRQYLSESSGETDFRAPIVRAFNRAIRLRAAADLIADIPTPPPLSAYPRVREVLEFHVDAICDRLAGLFDVNHPWVPISDDFVLALRAESTGDDLSVSAALPLVTVAASLGELELIYPVPVPCRTRRHNPYRVEVCGISAFGGIVPNFPALKSSRAWINSDLEFITNGP